MEAWMCRQASLQCGLVQLSEAKLALGGGGRACLNSSRCGAGGGEVSPGGARFVVCGIGTVAVKEGWT
jgi:hypothetical protein